MLASNNLTADHAFFPRPLEIKDTVFNHIIISWPTSRKISNFAIRSLMRYRYVTCKINNLTYVINE